MRYQYRERCKNKGLLRKNRDSPLRGQSLFFLATTRVLLFIFLVLSFACGAEAADLHKRENIPGLIYWHGDSDEKKVALTFDDGPNAPYTNGVLNVLKEHNVKATFFVIGKYVRDYPHITKRIVQEGHTIGNHTYNHPDLRFMFNNSVRREIKEAEE